MPFEAKPGRLTSAVKAALEGKTVSAAASFEAEKSDIGVSSLLLWDEEAQVRAPETYDEWEEKRQKKMAVALRALGRGEFVLMGEAHPVLQPYRAFTVSELTILRGAERDSRIIEAFNIFRATIVTVP